MVKEGVREDLKPDIGFPMAEWGVSRRAAQARKD